MIRVGFAGIPHGMIAWGTNAFARIGIAIRSRTANRVVIPAVVVAVILACIAIQVVLVLALCGDALPLDTLRVGTVGDCIVVTCGVVIAAMQGTVQFAFAIMQIGDVAIALRGDTRTVHAGAGQAVRNCGVVANTAYCTAVLLRVGFASVPDFVVSRGTNALSRIGIAISTHATIGIVIPAMVVAVILAGIAMQMVFVLALGGNALPLDTLRVGTVGNRIGVACGAVIAAMQGTVQLAFVVI